LPNVGHCGGPAAGGPNEFDPLTALEQWIEEGIAPEDIIASRVTDGVVTRMRPICAYAQMAQYVGSGSIDDAANFVCRQPHNRSRPSTRWRTLITAPERWHWREKYR
jgi:feruloyl esterase